MMRWIALFAVLFGVAAYGQSIDTIGGNPSPSGAAGGVLSGTYPNPGFAASPTFTGTVTLPTQTNILGALLLPSGTVLTAPVSGYIENNGTNLFYTATSGPTRHTLAFTDVAQTFASSVTSTQFIAPSTTTASGDFSVGATTGNVRVGTGSVPTIASGACGTGTNGTLAAGSRSNAGTVQIGAATATTCTVVFATSMTTAPVCVFSPADSAGVGATVLAYISANTTGGFVITGTALANVNLNYICL